MSKKLLSTNIFHDIYFNGIAWSPESNGISQRQKPRARRLTWIFNVLQVANGPLGSNPDSK